MRLTIFKNVFFSSISGPIILQLPFKSLLSFKLSRNHLLRFFDVYLEEPRPPYISRGRPEFFDIYIISSELLFEFMKNTTHQKLIFNNVSETRFFETTSLFLWKFWWCRLRHSSNGINIHAARADQTLGLTLNDAR